MQRYKVVIAEDHIILREGLRSMIESLGRFTIVGEIDNGLDTIRCLDATAPDLLLLDLSMPKMTGLSVLREISKRYSVLKIIVLTMHDSEEYLEEAFRCGAQGYCLKTSPFSELTKAIDMVLEGKLYVHPVMAGPVLQKYLEKPGSEPADSSWEALTARERVILKLVGEGHKNKDIAQLLCISIKTVEKHRANLMAKLDIHNAATLTRYAIKKGLILPPH